MNVVLQVQVPVALMRRLHAKHKAAKLALKRGGATPKDVLKFTFPVYIRQLLASVLNRQIRGA